MASEAKTPDGGLVRATFEQGNMGINLQSVDTSKYDPVHESHVAITAVAPGSPAEAAGLPVGGLLVEINGQDVRGMAPDQVAQIAKARPVSIAVHVPNTSHSVETLLAGMLSQMPLELLSLAEKEQYRKEIAACTSPDNRSAIIERQARTLLDTRADFVVIHGLASRPDLNGKGAQIIGPVDAKSGRVPVRAILGNDPIRDTTDVKVRFHNLAAAPRAFYDMIEATGWFKLYRSTLHALERHFHATVSGLAPGLPKTDVLLDMASDLASRVDAFHLVFELQIQMTSDPDLQNPAPSGVWGRV